MFGRNPNHRFDGERKAGSFESVVDQQQAGRSRQQRYAEQSGQLDAKQWMRGVTLVVEQICGLPDRRQPQCGQQQQGKSDRDRASLQAKARMLQKK